MVLPVEYTKGLEFDAVLIFDPTREDYPVEDGHAKLLYVISRSLPLSFHYPLFFLCRPFPFLAFPTRFFLICTFPVYAALDGKMGG